MSPRIGREVLSDGVAFRSERAEVVVRRLRPGYLLMRIDGYTNVACHQEVISAFEDELKRGRLTFFVDGYNFDNYESRFRELWTSWLAGNRKQLDAVHLLTRSPFVRMGLRVVNLATGNLLTPYAERAAFYAELHKIAPEFIDRGEARTQRA